MAVHTGFVTINGIVDDGDHLPRPENDMVFDGDSSRVLILKDGSVHTEQETYLCVAYAVAE